jgi:hypothetical protein
MNQKQIVIKIVNRMQGVDYGLWARTVSCDVCGSTTVWQKGDEHVLINLHANQIKTCITSMPLPHSEHTSVYEGFKLKVWKSWRASRNDKESKHP